MKKSENGINFNDAKEMYEFAILGLDLIGANPEHPQIFDFERAINQIA